MYFKWIIMEISRAAKLRDEILPLYPNQPKSPQPKSPQSKSPQSKSPKKSEKSSKLKNGIGIFLSNIALITSFATIYSLFLNESHWNGLDHNSTWFDCFYFSFTTMTTIGFGDISPKSQAAKIVCIFQQVIVLFQLANILSKIAIQKPLKIRFKKSPQKLTSGQKIGRQRRYNSCQLDYMGPHSSRNHDFESNISYEENDVEVRITFPLPPTT